MNEQIAALCYEIATKAHEGQTRRDGRTPYIEHPRAVANKVRAYGLDHVCVAILHDVLEDSDLSPIDLTEQGVPLAIVLEVDRLTKREGETYNEFIARIRPFPVARRVKIADILHNLSDTPTVAQVKKYATALLFLVD
ncbi:MAG: hypothetical protein NVV63_12595 [Opitutus sp.]|nr:hypothetical protein [Opitutus sp.]